MLITFETRKRKLKKSEIFILFYFNYYYYYYYYYYYFYYYYFFWGGGRVGDAGMGAGAKSNATLSPPELFMHSDGQR